MHLTYTKIRLFSRHGEQIQLRANMNALKLDKKIASNGSPQFKQ